VHLYPLDVRVGNAQVIDSALCHKRCNRWCLLRKTYVRMNEYRRAFSAIVRAFSLFRSTYRLRECSLATRLGVGF
jgi:hypothetical protein